MSQAITISPQQRDLLCDRILVHLTGIDDVWVAAGAEDFETADRLAHEFCDELHLVMEDLGWGKHRDSAVVFTSHPDILRRVVERLRATATVEDADEEEERIELRELAEVSHQIGAICDQILAQLGEVEASG